MQSLLTDIALKKARLDALRPIAEPALRQLQKFYDVELTYTSNAIEGNTLTLRETAEVIEHGITVGGKKLKDHLEAVDHYNAVLWMRDLALQSTPVTEAVVRDMHSWIVARSEPDIAGVYSPHRRRIAGSSAGFPNPAKVPELMRDFGAWAQTAPPTPKAAFDAHFRLTAIHPFSDGNGRTARLLMNLLLLRAGYPPVAVRPEDRGKYLEALEHGSVNEDQAPFQSLMHERPNETLAAYLSALGESPAAISDG